MAVAGGGDALDGVVGTGKRRDVRDLVLDGGLADGAFVLDGVALCPRRVDDEVHLLVQDDVEDVRAAFGNLVHHFALDTGSFVELGGTFGSVNLEAELLEFLADFDSLFGEVHLVRKADEHSAFGREEGTCGFLALVVSEGVVVGKAEHFVYDDRSTYGRVTNLGDQRHRAKNIFFGRSPHVCGSGYILWVARFTSFPSNFIKRSLAPKNIKKELPASLRPKGSLTLTQKPHPRRKQSKSVLLFRGSCIRRF